MESLDEASFRAYWQAQQRQRALQNGGSHAQTKTRRQVSAAITNTGRPAAKGSSRSWMTKYGIRRYYQPNWRQSVPAAANDQLVTAASLVMPSIGRGLWLDTDCRCALARQKAIREQLQKITVKPEVSLPMPPALRIISLTILTLRVLTAMLTPASQICHQFCQKQRRKRLDSLRQGGQGQDAFSLCDPEYAQK